VGGAVKRALFVVAVVVAALVPAACGSSAKTTTLVGPISGTRLSVYVSVPLHGASRVSGQSVINGATLALDQAGGRVGRYQIVLKTLDDATVKTEGWDPVQTTNNVRLAVLDPTTIAYLGDMNSGASAISIPPLNRVGIPQISPTGGAVGLTSSGPGSNPGEPAKYYPTGQRTFVRIAPNNAIQATAQVQVQKSMGCATAYVLEDGEVDGADAARSYEVAALQAGIKLVGIQQFVRRATNYESVALAVKHAAPNCVLISSDTESGAVLLTTQLLAAIPTAKIFGTSGLAESTYTEPGEGGIPLSDDPHVILTVPTLGLNDYPSSARKFVAAYKQRYGPPEPDAIFGYEAMSLLLNAIDRATDGGRAQAERSKVRAAIFATRDRQSVVGTYSVQPDGDTTLRTYGVWGIVGGQLSFWEAITA
jgi:branched-chain amino acid transport system substrate-binding protein